jgi:alpha-N-arabinofuranosidase
MRYARTCLALALVVCGCSGPHASMPAVDALAARFSGSVPSIVLDGNSRGPAVSADVYGASLATWYEFYRPFVKPSLQSTGIRLVRFPGGSESDAYHWEKGGSVCAKQGYVAPHASFQRLMSATAEPLGLDIAITLNYGSNRTCNGGGDPNEAAAWVADAKAHGYNVPFSTVGNEVYGSWEYDLHARPHDPYTYANAVRTGYYPAVKKANPSAKLGIVGDFANPGTRRWNSIVFKNAQPFDFVEVHYYPQYEKDSDSLLLGPAIDTFARDVQALRDQMNAAGLPATMPIYLGEYNNDAGQEGKQSVSIVNGLYLGQMLGTLVNAGVPMATWWLAYGSCDQRGDYSKKLYGWQHFGSEALFSDGLPEYGCENAPRIPGGTPFPPARVMALFHATVPPGSLVRSVSVSPGLSNVRAYGFAEGSGYAVVAFNDTLQDQKAQVIVSNAKTSPATTGG